MDSSRAVEESADDGPVWVAAGLDFTADEVVPVQPMSISAPTSSKAAGLDIELRFTRMGPSWLPQGHEQQGPDARPASTAPQPVGHDHGMNLPSIGTLPSLPVTEHPELLAPTVAQALEEWEPASSVAVVEIDPRLADTATMMEAFSLPIEAGANCVVVAGRRGGEERIAACVVRADMRADVNNLVKRTLDVRKSSFLRIERAVEESAMEYGGITPMGLPVAWRVLVDSTVLNIDVAIIGSGVRRSKLLLPGKLLAELPSAEVIEGLGR
jgi:prolyl-tRNA editing enzyme YbaK/EbsC (Cys-tRNA(Pro) deacylase)